MARAPITTVTTLDDERRRLSYFRELRARRANSSASKLIDEQTRWRGRAMRPSLPANGEKRRSRRAYERKVNSAPPAAQVDGLLPPPVALVCDGKRRISAVCSLRVRSARAANGSTSAK